MVSNRCQSSEILHPVIYFLEHISHSAWLVAAVSGHPCCHSYCLCWWLGRVFLVCLVILIAY